MIEFDELHWHNKLNELQDADVDEVVASIRAWLLRLWSWLVFVECSYGRANRWPVKLHRLGRVGLVPFTWSLKAYRFGGCGGSGISYRWLGFTISAFESE